jgi:thioredoxin-like negative regulator of GroEL
MKFSLFDLAGIVFALAILAGLLVFGHCHELTAPITPPSIDLPAVQISPAMEETFTAATRRSAETAKPALALFTAEWCGPCRRVERDTLPALREDLKDRDIPLAIVDVDKEPSAVAALGLADQRIPQFVLYQADAEYRAQPLGRIVGNQSPEQLRAFLEQPIARSDPPRTIARPAATLKRRSPWPQSKYSYLK